MVQKCFEWFFPNHKSSFFFVRTNNLCLYSSSPTSILELPEVLIRKLLRQLFLLPSITMIIGQNPLGE